MLLDEESQLPSTALHEHHNNGLEIDAINDLMKIEGILPEILKDKGEITKAVQAIENQVVLLIPFIHSYNYPHLDAEPNEYLLSYGKRLYLVSTEKYQDPYYFVEMLLKKFKDLDLKTGYIVGKDRLLTAMLVRDRFSVKREETQESLSALIEYQCDETISQGHPFEELKKAIRNRHDLELPVYYLIASMHPDRITPATKFTLMIANDAVHTDLDLYDCSEEEAKRSYTSHRGIEIATQLNNAEKSKTRQHVYNKLDKKGVAITNTQREKWTRDS